MVYERVLAHSIEEEKARMTNLCSQLYTFYGAGRVALGLAEQAFPHIAWAASSVTARTSLLALDCIATAWIGYQAWQRLAPVPEKYFQDPPLTPDEKSINKRYTLDRIVDVALLGILTVAFVKYSERLFTPSMDLTSVLQKAGISDECTTVTWCRIWEEQALLGLTCARAIFGALLAHHTSNDYDDKWSWKGAVLQLAPLLLGPRLRWVALTQMYDRHPSWLGTPAGVLQSQARFYLHLPSLHPAEMATQIKAVYDYSQSLLEKSWWSMQWTSSPTRGVAFSHYDVILHSAQAIPSVLKRLTLQAHHVQSTWVHFKALDLTSSLWRVLLPRCFVPGYQISSTQWGKVEFSGLVLEPWKTALLDQIKRISSYFGQH